MLNCSVGGVQVGGRQRYLPPRLSGGVCYETRITTPRQPGRVRLKPHPFPALSVAGLDAGPAAVRKYLTAPADCPLLPVFFYRAVWGQQFSLLDNSSCLLAYPRLHCLITLYLSVLYLLTCLLYWYVYDKEKASLNQPTWRLPFSSSSRAAEQQRGIINPNSPARHSLQALQTTLQPLVRCWASTAHSSALSRVIPSRFPQPPRHGPLIQEVSLADLFFLRHCHSLSRRYRCLMVKQKG